MNFNDYQQLSSNTDVATPAINQYVDSLGIPNFEKSEQLKQLLGILYMTLGLVGEAGEIANKAKKLLRDNNGVIELSNLIALSKENGDVTWYNGQLFKKLGFTFEEGAQNNITNLQSRKEKETLHGDGDNR